MSNESPAFPRVVINTENKEYHEPNVGLTKLEYFAIHIAAGKSGDPKQIAEHAVWVAKLLIKELEKEDD